VRGASTIPFLGLIPTAVFAYLAFRERHIYGATLPLYVTAAILAPLSTPFTLAVLKPVNDELTARSEKAIAGAADVEAAGAGESTHELVRKWAGLNLLRGVMFGLSAVLAGWAAIRPVELVEVAVEGFEFVSGANRLG